MKRMLFAAALLLAACDGKPAAHIKPKIPTPVIPTGKAGGDILAVADNLALQPEPIARLGVGCMGTSKRTMKECVCWAKSVAAAGLDAQTIDVLAIADIAKYDAALKGLAFSQATKALAAMGDAADKCDTPSPSPTK